LENGSCGKTLPSTERRESVASEAVALSLLEGKECLAVEN